MAKTIAIIPAKGYSRRVPKKNLRLLGGKPLLYYVLSAAKNSALVDELYVSTDDEEIAEYAKSQGARVPFLRDTSLSGDAIHGTAPVLDMLQKLYPDADNSLYCLRLLAPFPFLSAQSLESVIKKSRDAKKNVVSITPLDLNVYHLKKLNDDGTISAATEKSATNFQIDDAPELYALCGAAQCMPARDLIETRSYQHGRPLGHVISKMEAFEVDTPELFDLAERLLPVLLES